MGQLLRQQWLAVRAILGDEVDEGTIGQFDQGFWNRHRAVMVALLAPILGDIFLRNAALSTAAATAIGLDWGIMVDAAAEWASSYSFELVNGLNNTTQQLLQREIARAVDLQLPIDELRRRLVSTFGPVRAQLIAQTEVTRAAAEGSRALIRELEEFGAQFETRWITFRDDRVCEICRPLDYELRGEDGYTHPVTGATIEGPPAHPNCRCEEDHRAIEPDE